jgi:hypothetical protein
MSQERPRERPKDKDHINEVESGSVDGSAAKSGSSTIQKPASDPLHLEARQPDPMLQLSVGRIGAGGLSLIALVVVVILVVVFFGLNVGGPSGSTPPLPSTPAAGGNSAAGTPGAVPSRQGG